MNIGDCTPLNCSKAMGCIESLRDPAVSPMQWSALRSQLADCGPCARAFDVEAKLRTTMVPTQSFLPSPDLASRITETMASMDLSQLDITDF